MATQAAPPRVPPPRHSLRMEKEQPGAASSPGCSCPWSCFVAVLGAQAGGQQVLLPTDRSSSQIQPGKEQQCPDQEAAASPSPYLGHSCWVRPGAVLPPPVQVPPSISICPTGLVLQGSCRAPAVTAGDTAGLGAASSGTWLGSGTSRSAHGASTALGAVCAGGVPPLPSTSKEPPGPSPSSPSLELQALTRAFHYLGFLSLLRGGRCTPRNNQPSTSSPEAQP